jgi:hypothetical protein
MRKQAPLIAFAACIATLSSVAIPTAQAKQKCRAEMPSIPHGYWSWRLIDGRKCWYVHACEIIVAVACAGFNTTEFRWRIYKRTARKAR